MSTLKTMSQARLVPLDWWRFWRLFAIWGAVVAMASGAAVTLQAGVGLHRFGGSEYLPRATALIIVREGGGSVASAAVLALVQWAHAIQPTQLQRLWRSALFRGLLGVVIATPIATVLALASSFAVGLSAYGIDWSVFCSSVTHILSPGDFAAGFGEAVVSGLVLVPLACVLLPRLARLAWDVPLKLAAAWLGLFAMGMLTRAVKLTIP